MESLTHFENLFANPDENDAFEDIEIEEPDNEIEELIFNSEILDDEIFNSEIMDDEIVFAVKSLKAGKSPGPDGIISEMFINILEVILPILKKLFNHLFSQGPFPELWSKSFMISLHKKGDTEVVDNYRGISLLDTFGKIYTSC